MPRLTNQELKDLRYISMVDYCKRVRTYENMDDKLRFTTQYLLLHGTGVGEPDYSIEEATYIAQLALGTASIMEKEKLGPNERTLVNNNPQLVNPHVESPDQDLAHELFMNDPYQYLKGYASKNVKNIDRLKNPSEDDLAFKQQCVTMISDKLDPLNFSSDVYDMVSKNSPVGVRIRMETKLGSKEQLDALYKATKPGFFSKMFNTSSLAAKNLDQVYNAFNNPNHALFGDKAALKKAAQEYLVHKFPGWKEGEPLPNISEHPELDETSQARTLLSVSALEAIEAQERFENPVRELVDETCKKQIKFSEADRPPLNQNVFRDGVANDINDESVLIEDQPEDEMEPELNIEKLMENMVPDKDD